MVPVSLDLSPRCKLLPARRPLWWLLFTDRPAVLSQAVVPTSACGPVEDGGRLPSHALPATRTPPVATTPSRAWPSQRRPGGPHATSRPGSGSVRLGRATRWCRVRDVRATRWRRVVRYFLATAHMLTLVPLGGAECAMCVPLGGVEWCARDTARLRSHQRGRRHRRAAQRPRAAGLPVKSNLWRCRAVPAVQSRIAHVSPISYKNFLFMLELQRQFARSSFIMDGASWKGEGRRPRGKGDPR